MDFLKQHLDYTLSWQQRWWGNIWWRLPKSRCFPTPLSLRRTLVTDSTRNSGRTQVWTPVPLLCAGGLPGRWGLTSQPQARGPSHLCSHPEHIWISPMCLKLDLGLRWAMGVDGTESVACTAAFVFLLSTELGMGGLSFSCFCCTANSCPKSLALSFSCWTDSRRF